MTLEPIAIVPMVLFPRSKTIVVLQLVLGSLSFSATAWTAEWINLKGSNCIAPPRSGHVAFGLENKVYVFGGYAEDPSTAERYPTNDLWCFDGSANEKNAWTLVKEASSSQPQPRLASAAVTCRLGGDTKQPVGMVLGGWDSQVAGTGGVILKDIQAFCGSDETWKELPTDLEEPTSRLCALALSPEQVLIHNHRCIDHVLLLDTENSKLSKQSVSGTSPSARGLHVCARLPGTSKIVLFGGAAQSGEMSNEVFVLDTETWEWEKCLSSNGSPLPVPRASPCLVAIDEKSCILFGGASPSDDLGLHGHNDTWLLELEKGDGDSSVTAKWTLMNQDGSKDAPPGRNAATLIPLSSAPRMLPVEKYDDSQYFLLSGGWYPFRTTHGDNFVLKVSKE